MANIHEHAVLADVLEPSGSGFVGRHGEDFLLANNAQWVGFGIEIGPDGSIYVLDWHDADICGADVVNKETGRVFRIFPQRTDSSGWSDRNKSVSEESGAELDLSKQSDRDLAGMQLYTSAWHARRARLLLQARAAKRPIDKQAIDDLLLLYELKGDFSFRLRAMWALHTVGELPVNRLLEALKNREAYIRAWAIQLLCEDGQPTRAVLDRFRELAGNDPSPVVRLYLASALQRIDVVERWPIAQQLVRHSEDAADHNIPKMIWFGIEPAVPTDPARALELASTSRIPLVTRQIARRLGDADRLDAVVRGLVAPSDVRHLLLLGLRDALDGRFDVEPPTSWTQAYAFLESCDDETAKLANEIALQFRDTETASKLLTALSSDQSTLELRRHAIHELSRRRHPELQPLLTALLDESPLRRDAIQAAAAYRDERLARQLLDRYASFGPEEKLDAVHTLAARSSSGQLLTRAIAQDVVPRTDIPAYVARLLRRIVGARFAEVWGPVDDLSTDRESYFSKYRQLIHQQALHNASRQRGADVFKRTCMACHKMYGQGGEVGPDLTGANRANLEYLLGNILTPSAVIQDAYKMQIVLTDSGRVYSGILAAENEHQLRLRVPEKPDPIVIPKSSIESREIATVSMMPEGLLKNLSDGEVLDLFAYLMSKE